MPQAGVLLQGGGGRGEGRPPPEADLQGRAGQVRGERRPPALRVLRGAPPGRRADHQRAPLPLALVARLLLLLDRPAQERGEAGGGPGKRGQLERLRGGVQAGPLLRRPLPRVGQRDPRGAGAKGALLGRGGQGGAAAGGAPAGRT